MFGMWDVGDVGCSGCGMFGMWDFGDVGCWGCGMFGMWYGPDVGCGMFAGMWDVDLQNAVTPGKNEHLRFQEKMSVVTRGTLY